MKKLVVVRRISQGLFLALFIHILWSTTYPLTGFFPPSTFFVTDPLLIIMTSVAERIVLPGLVFALGMTGLALVLGRVFCGWACPLGTSIDIAGACRRRRPGTEPTDMQNRAVRRIKFILLALITAAAFAGKQVAWIFDPIVLAARFVSLNLIPAATAAIKAVFVIGLRDLKLGGSVRDFYHALKPTVLGVKTMYFPHAGLILAYFLVVVLASLFISRLWCRGLCPLGAFYSLVGRCAPLHRTVDVCTQCGRCRAACRTGAIRDDLTYAKGECVLCMDCVYACPPHGTRFTFERTASRAVRAPQVRPSKDSGGGVTRTQFLMLMFSSLALLGFKRRQLEPVTDSGSAGSTVIRPPAALEEKDFIGRCVRCGNCMKVCITNGLQPAMFEAGYDGIWTPRLVPEIGYCEYRCTLCGTTCPTGAIPKITLEQKMLTPLGVAEVDRSLCIPWAEGKECIVCQEHCPVPEKAIMLDREGGGVQKPRVSEELCVGCGICQYKCPIRPARAIRVVPRNSYRTKI